MIKLKDLIKDWNDRKFKKLPKRWTKKYNEINDGLTEFERSGGKDKISEAISVKDAGDEIFDTIIAFKNVIQKSPYKKNRKINMYIKQLLKIEQQLSDVVGDLE